MPRRNDEPETEANDLSESVPVSRWLDIARWDLANLKCARRFLAMAASSLPGSSGRSLP